MIKRIPIAVAYKKKYGNKVYVQEFLNERTPDSILSVRSNKLPKHCIIQDIGVGSKFYYKYKTKYS